MLCGATSTPKPPREHSSAYVLNARQRGVWATRKVPCNPWPDGRFQRNFTAAVADHQDHCAYRSGQGNHAHKDQGNYQSQRHRHTLCLQF